MRKRVTDEMFLATYGPLNANMEELNSEQQKNRRIIKAASKSYKGLISDEDLLDCELEAVCRCLSYYNKDKGKKLTSNLWTFVRWECDRQLRKQKPNDNDPIIFSINDSKAPQLQNEEASPEIVYLRDCIEALCGHDKEIIQEYYLYNHTIEEIGKRHKYSKETARQKLKKAEQLLREIYIQNR
jgi:RNA polymerase sigma factor (sigma-70 family)